MTLEQEYCIKICYFQNPKTIFGHYSSECKYVPYRLGVETGCVVILELKQGVQLFTENIQQKQITRERKKD